MNSPDELADPPQSSAPEPADPGQPPSPNDAPLSTARQTGKIARLPKALRDRINLLLQEGVSYADIIESLGEAGSHLNVMNLSRWKDGGHQDWLLQQNWLAQTRARQEPATDLSTDFDATQLNHAALQLATLQIFEALRDLGSGGPPQSAGGAPSDEASAERDPQHPQALGIPGDPVSSSESTDLAGAALPAAENQKSSTRNRSSRSQLDLRLGGDSAAFIRLINALARASRETVLVQKYREACSQARAALRELKDPKRKLTDEERRAIVRNVDEILGLAPIADYPEPAPMRGSGTAPVLALDPSTAGGA